MSISEWMKIPYAPAILWTPIWTYLMSVSYEYSMRWLTLCWSTPVWAGSSGHYLSDSQGSGTWSSPSPFSTFCSVKYLNKSLVSVQAASTLNKSELSRLQVTEAQVKLSELQTLLVQTTFLPCVSVVWLLSLLSQADFLHRAIRSTINPPGPTPPRPCQTHSHWSQVQHAWGNSLVGPACLERWHSQKEGQKTFPRCLQQHPPSGTLFSPPDLPGCLRYQSCSSFRTDFYSAQSLLKGLTGFPADPLHSSKLP